MKGAARSKTSIGAVLVAAALAGCGEEAQTGPAENAESTIEAVSWGYEGAEGPANWGELSTDFATCATGEEQSPIELSDAERTNVTDVEYGYHAADFDVVDTGHTVQANVAGDAGGIALNGESYELVQFHTHTPSEHTIGGEPADVELHLVHQNAGGELAVVGVLLDEGEAGPLSEAFGELPAEGETQSLQSFDASSLLPKDTGSFRYQGSLTTPPCTEGVSWIVLEETGTVDPSLVEILRDRYGDNARPVQPLEERTLELDSQAA